MNKLLISNFLKGESGEGAEKKGKKKKNLAEKISATLPSSFSSPGKKPPKGEPVADEEGAEKKAFFVSRGAIKRQPPVQERPTPEVRFLKEKETGKNRTRFSLFGVLQTLQRRREERSSREALAAARRGNNAPSVSMRGSLSAEALPALSLDSLGPPPSQAPPPPPTYEETAAAAAPRSSTWSLPRPKTCSRLFGVLVFVVVAIFAGTLLIGMTGHASKLEKLFRPAPCPTMTVEERVKETLEKLTENLNFHEELAKQLDLDQIYAIKRLQLRLTGAHTPFNLDPGNNPFLPPPSPWPPRRKPYAGFPRDRPSTTTRAPWYYPPSTASSAAAPAPAVPGRSSSNISATTMPRENGAENAAEEEEEETYTDVVVTGEQEDGEEDDR